MFPLIAYHKYFENKGACESAPNCNRKLVTEKYPFPQCCRDDLLGDAFSFCMCFLFGSVKSPESVLK